MKQSSNESMELTHFESLYPSDSRSEEISKIIRLIKEGKSIQLIGLPGVGRSNILRLLSYNKNIRKKHLEGDQKWFHFVYCDFSEIRKRPTADVVKFIFLRLVDSLRERKVFKTKESEFEGEGSFEEIDKIFKESLSGNDEMVLFQGLKRAIDFLCIEKKLTIVFLFDRFEEYVPNLTPEFFASLRILRNRAKYRFSAVFSINKPLEDLIEPTLFADFYEFISDNTVYLSLVDNSGLDFRISYIEKVSGKKIDEKIKEEILRLTGGHGKLTRLSLEALTETNKNDLRSQLLNLKSVRGALYEIWASLSPSEKSSLKKNELNSDYLKNTGLISESKISVPLFEDFLKSVKLEEDKIYFDKDSNEIKRGESVFSDLLTSSEFRLLKFLIENPEKTIEREEIIKAVWKDEKTTEGVTDQALDQLLFRLRKKIEDDPNNPTHLQTLKGKGVKFSP